MTLLLAIMALSAAEQPRDPARDGWRGSIGDYPHSTYGALLPTGAVRPFDEPPECSETSDGLERQVWSAYIMVGCFVLAAATLAAAMLWRLP